MTAVVLDGIVLGLAFGLLGVGMTLVYGLGGVLNLAYGQMVVLAAIVVMLVMDDGVATVLAAAAGVLAVAGVAVLLDLTLMRAVYREHGEERTLLGLLLTLGVAFVIAGLLTWRYPSGALYIYIGGDPVSILGVPMAVGSIWASVIALLVAAVLLLFFGLTTFGRGVRSIIQDETGARLVGINPSFVRTVIFALSGALAGIVAITQSMSGPLTVNAGFELTTFALIVTVVGGLGSVAGAFLAGVLLGVVNTLSAHYIGQYITTIILLGAAALTILIRPRGLLGRWHGEDEEHRLGAPADPRDGGDPRDPPVDLVRGLALHDVARRPGTRLRRVRRRLQPHLREHEPALPVRRRAGRDRRLRRRDPHRRDLAADGGGRRRGHGERGARRRAVELDRGAALARDHLHRHRHARVLARVREPPSRSA